MTKADQPAFILAPGGRALSFGEFDRNANRLAHFLREQGLRRGDHIAILMENNLRYFEVMAAAERSGLYYTCINSYLTADEVAYIVNDCDAKVFITSAAKVDVAIDAAPRCSRLSARLCVDTDQEYEMFDPYDATISTFPETPVPDQQLGAAMLYSSGTTGRPKGIVRPLPDARPDDELPVMAFAKTLLRLRSGMVYLSPGPIYHAAPQASVSAAVRLGAPSIIMERFDAELWLRCVAEHHCTHTNMVPTMFVRLLRLDETVRNQYDLSSLEVIAHTGAPCPVGIKKDMIEWVGPILIEYYGATEGNGYTFCDSQEWLAHPGTVGRPIFGEVDIRDTEGRHVPVGTVGRVWFTGATNFSYHRDPAKTEAACDESGQSSTVGDIGYVDDDGYLYLTDREAFMIVSGGVNIYPQEIEDRLITHHKVADAAVFGVPSAEFGEEVKAVVQLEGGVTPDDDIAAELLAYCRAGLAAYKCPKSIDFEESLPRLPTGKLYKQVLRDRYWGDEPSRIAR